LGLYVVEIGTTGDCEFRGILRTGIMILSSLVEIILRLVGGLRTGGGLCVIILKHV
jgi:hypothetical protein